jgi:ribosomal protein L11 methyltransferase
MRPSHGVLIGDRFRVVPPGSPPGDGAAVDLIIARGAFGSGEHETTVSCLELLAALPELEGGKLLDLGSGTGVLAIAAIKLGAAEAVCVDVDAKAVAVAKASCALSSVEDRVRHVHGQLEDLIEERFDVVVANLYGDILITLAPSVVAVAKAHAPLVLSGILWEDSYPLRSRYQSLGCTLRSSSMLEEYCSVVLEAPGPRHSTVAPFV